MKLKKQKNKKTKQSYEKKMYPKLMLNKLKVMGNHTVIYTHWAPHSKEFFKKNPFYMWPMFAHVHPCVNYEWTKNKLEINKKVN